MVGIICLVLTHNPHVLGPDRVVAMSVRGNWAVVVLSGGISKVIGRPCGCRAGPEEEHNDGWKASSDAVLVVIADSGMETPVPSTLYNIFFFSSTFTFTTADVRRKKKFLLESIEIANTTGLIT